MSRRYIDILLYFCMFVYMCRHTYVLTGTGTRWGVASSVGLQRNVRPGARKNTRQGSQCPKDLFAGALHPSTRRQRTTEPDLMQDLGKLKRNQKPYKSPAPQDCSARDQQIEAARSLAVFQDKGPTRIVGHLPYPTIIRIESQNSIWTIRSVRG